MSFLRILSCVERGPLVLERRYQSDGHQVCATSGLDPEIGLEVEHGPSRMEKGRTHSAMSPDSGRDGCRLRHTRRQRRRFVRANQERQARNGLPANVTAIAFTVALHRQRRRQCNCGARTAGMHPAHVVRLVRLHRASVTRLPWIQGSAGRRYRSSPEHQGEYECKRKRSLARPNHSLALFFRRC
jgi:hypothetical protein